jgi:hypothetical protein
MKRMLLMGLAILGFAISCEGDIIVSPSAPTSVDSVKITVYASVGSGGYAINDVTARVDANTITLDVFWSVPGPGAMVTLMFEEHGFAKWVGRLPPGTYTVEVIHHVLGRTESASFIVTPGNPGSAPPADPAEGIDSLAIILQRNSRHIISLPVSSPPSCDCFCHKWPQLFAGRACPFCGCGGQSTPSTGTGSLMDRMRGQFAALRQRCGIQ